MIEEIEKIKYKDLKIPKKKWRFPHCAGRLDIFFVWCEKICLVWHFEKKKYSKESFQLRDSYDENHNGKKNVKKPIGLTELVTDRMRDGQFVRPLLIALFVQSFVHLDDWVRLSLNKFEDSLETKNKRNDEMMRRVYGWTWLNAKMA